jgi:hypothetical protein
MKLILKCCMLTLFEFQEREAIYSWSRNPTFHEGTCHGYDPCLETCTCRQAVVPWPDISWSATTGTCHDSSCINCFDSLRECRTSRDSDEDILRNFISQGWLPEQVAFQTDLDLVMSVTSSLAKALWCFTFQGDLPSFGNFDRICYEFLRGAFAILISPFGISWSIEDGFVFYPLRDLFTARVYLKGREAPATDKILDCLLTVMCCGETLTSVNSPAIANLCGTWIESIWFTKGQADALQFANTVIRRILQPLLKTKPPNEDVPFAVALWLPSNFSRRTSNPRRSIDTNRVNVYDLDPATNLRRLIKILSQCPDPKSKKLTRESYYRLPLDYHDDGHILDKLFLVSPKRLYRFIYSVEKRPGFRHLLYLFQGETIRDFERITSSVRSRRQKIEDKGRGNDEAQNNEAQNDESIPPSLTSSIDALEASESATARCNNRPRKSVCRETAKYYYLMDFRYKPSFPQFGIEGDQETINCGIRAPPLPCDVPLVNTTSNDTKEKTHIFIHVLS